VQTPSRLGWNRAATRFDGSVLGRVAPLRSRCIEYNRPGGKAGRSGVKRRGIAALLLALALQGCLHVAGTVPPRSPAQATGRFLGGAARVDITPIPGIAMGGHSTIGRISRGVWTRLHARALYLEDAAGRGLVLVGCDLWSIPGGLSDRVAQLLATKAELLAMLGGRSLGREQLVLAATHTHHSPGLYSTDLFFASLAAKQGGFDPELFEFLAQRIAWVIAEAVQGARPAHVYENQVRVARAFRNRSMPAFRANSEAQAIIDANHDLPRCERSDEYPDADACQGIDPRVVTLRIESTEGDLIGLFVQFAAHPTLINHISTVYSADLHGAVALEIERRLAARSESPAAPPPVAVFNGAEGDVSGIWTRQTRADVLRVADIVVDEVWSKLVSSSPADWRRVDGDIGFQVEKASLRGQVVRHPSVGKGRTAWIPMPGRASAAGAEDGRSGIAPRLFHEGKQGVDLGAHGAKIGTLDFLNLFGVTIPPFWLTRAMTLVIPPPSRVAIGLYRLGPLRLVALPGEFTTTLGRRIAQEVALADAPREDVLILGLAQDYAYYFTTPEEYDLQHYEGSSTLYGRWSGAHLQSRFAELARKLAVGNTAAASHAFDHRTGGRYESDPRRLVQPPMELDEGTEAVAGANDWPQHCWNDDVPTLAGRSAGACALTQGGWECATPRVGIEVEAPSGWQPYRRDRAVEDDRGKNLLTLAGSAADSGAAGVSSSDATIAWCSYWLVSKDTPPARYRFAVQTVEGRLEHSPGFELDGQRDSVGFPSN
jgi:neutral ceramidase